MSQPVAEVGGYKNITATGAVTPGPCQLIGFYVNNTTIGTLVLRNGGADRVEPHSRRQHHDQLLRAAEDPTCRGRGSDLLR